MHREEQCVEQGKGQGRIECVLTGDDFYMILGFKAAVDHDGIERR